MSEGDRVLAIMGSGETSPTMVTVHRTLAARLTAGHPRAVVLETPYRFQDNADDISAAARKYFADSVGLPVTVLDGLRPAPAAAAAPGAAEPGVTEPGQAAQIRAADWVFAGPGSPTFALGQWRDSQVAEAIKDRVTAGLGVTVLASAAAVTVGLAALPVYEIYKVGEPPHWVEGLDLLSPLGLKVAVIPHYNNKEGGTYDTRYCYLGERRLALLERELPDDAAVLGVDEHTAAVFDLRARTVEVAGRGTVTVRRRGASTVLAAGTVVPLGDLAGLVSRGAPPAAGPHRAQPGQPQDQNQDQDDGLLPLPELTESIQRRFEAAERDRDAAAMVAAILDLDAAIHAWAADTDEDQGTGQARAVLRGLVTRLGQAAERGLADPRDQLRPAVQPLLTLRATLRGEGSYQAADTIRDALTAAGFELHDHPDSTEWTV
ncbi:MAG TPA: hypothetical protein VGH27_08280 [Streptosporangiaceae bacterium]|jgi:hypothetical protein